MAVSSDGRSAVEARRGQRSAGTGVDPRGRAAWRARRRALGITCVYLAVSEDIIREYGRCGGFPIEAVHQVRATIDPSTAELVR